MTACAPTHRNDVKFVQLSDEILFARATLCKLDNDIDDLYPI